MQFTLVYQGELPPNGDKKEKWRIRREIEPQLRKLWDLAPFNTLSRYRDHDYQSDDHYVGHSFQGVEYIPCVTKKLDLRAELDVQLFSSAQPGGLIHHGDIDNRMKTLLDALSRPQHKQQIPARAGVSDDGRLYCLLDDDSLITKITVTNGRLLTLPEGSKQALVLINVHPVAHAVTTANLSVAI
jgi:hypothetical protein